MQDDVQYRLLRLLAGLPYRSQRQLAEQLGMSVGRVNHCLKELVAEGLLIHQCEPGRRVRYRLSPAGREAGMRLRLKTLQRKLSEFETLRREIEELWEEMAAPLAESLSELVPGDPPADGRDHHH